MIDRTWNAWEMWGKIVLFCVAIAIAGEILRFCLDRLFETETNLDYLSLVIGQVLGGFIAYAMRRGRV